MEITGQKGSYRSATFVGNEVSVVALATQAATAPYGRFAEAIEEHAPGWVNSIYEWLHEKGPEVKRLRRISNLAVQSELDSYSAVPEHHQVHTPRLRLIDGADTEAAIEALDVYIPQIMPNIDAMNTGQAPEDETQRMIASTAMALVDYANAE
jgi:hypothetical protein